MTETRPDITASDGPQRAVKAFIIHLERATDRQPQVEELVRKLPVETEVVNAVDGRTLDNQTISRVYRRSVHRPRYPFQLSTNEIACFLSHRKAWQEIIDQRLDAGLVLEDDVELTPDFAAAYSAACQILKADSFIRFPFRERESGRVVLTTEGVRVIEPVPVGLGMVAQLVGREAAQRLLSATEIFDRPVDTTAQMNWITGLKPLSVLPGGVKEISVRLGGSTIQKSRSLPDKLKREILRPLYRWKIKSRSRAAV
ncbi:MULTISPECIES: glycosyltransferase family 25 protein [Brucella/Ochrobactrum group]|jgi:GR25 family glycosyltransferase involved in LPS biosynthesis|uniref:Glycosyltransferase family 25 protein n=1 Tax=Brucella pseudintermedia TaxID=370111 RepID=A0ABY5U9L7_9HYPH|nr:MULTISPECIES: glycosyltransferase family 25 protein [Brucella/Ochrobactrum group]KAB2682092.1 glycosyltransferase family 25 protein [Brucella pseudintermedia]NKE75835.1 glycosyltransferase family 25 protein [Ochrobactrum sp. MC-1LL]TWH02103.1 GR25 family glycosyltransferase involved in LPS biosynthesis [Ochrobactrum sp. J50]UWL60035.1 glycosyltransferase family 25 protein [Brucella pseudintermedia]WPM80455.1 glycosyltransferase family 25 protein [Brucella pseudintermedia]